MKKTKIKTKRVIAITILLIFILSSMLNIFPFNPSTLDNVNEYIENEEELDIIQPILSNGIGEDPWWNGSYQWRQCINITNPGTYDLIDNFVSVEFDYTELTVSPYNMDPDLYDVRIVENDVVRNYYVKKDFPSYGNATIWFETSVSAGESEYDTYMYWGNDTVNDRGTEHLNYDPSGTCWWSFEEGSGGYGSVTTDSLNYADGHLYGSSSSYYPDYSTDCVVGSYSLYFDGTHDFVYINDSLHFENPNEISQLTVSCWFKTSFSSSQDYTYNWAFLDFDRSEYFNFYIDCDNDANGGTTEGRIGFSSSASGYSGQNDFYGTTTDLNDGEWHFACIVYDGTDKIIYVDDGVEDARWPNAMGGRAFGTGVDRWGFIGDGSEATYENGARNNRYYQGYLDEIRYFEYPVDPDEIQWLANYYPIETNFLPITERAAAVTVIVNDVDGRRVPEAEVSLWENSTHILTVDSTVYTQSTLSDGTLDFYNVPFGTYNITVNYTLNSGLEKTVYDSRNITGGGVEFKGLIVLTTVNTSLWTIDFEVDDWDGDPLNYGYINVSTGSSEVLETLDLDSLGKATFRWINRSSYNYTIYYYNPDYTIQAHTKLNDSIILRAGIMNYSEFVVINMSKLSIRVMDETGTKRVTGVEVKVQLNGTDTDVVTLETDTTGYAYGDYTNDFGFWYKTEQVYNFSLWIIGQQQTFKVNTSDKWKPVLTNYYNYTLDQASTLVFFIDGINFTQRISIFNNSVANSSVIWGTEMHFSVIYETSDDGGTSWTPDWNEGGWTTSATWTIYNKYGQELLSLPMIHGASQGNFTLSINSNLFSAGNTVDYYYALVTGYKPFWNDPEEIYFGISIYARLTDISLHNYTSMPNELPRNVGGDYEVSEYYGFTVDIVAKFYDDETNSTLSPESFTYEWDYGSGSLVSGPLAGYFTFQVNTLAAPNVGKYKIGLTVALENYSVIKDFEMYIDILSRPTMINGKEGLDHIVDEIYIFEAINFTFEYTDTFSSNPITNLDVKSYLLQKLDENGEPIPETTEIGELIETIDNKFILDLDTEHRLDGKYSIIVTLDKTNYDYTIAFITLTINTRAIDIEWSDIFVDSKVSIDSGASLRFTITLTDPTNNSALITGANAYITLKGQNYYFNETGLGIYTVNIPKIADAFFMPQTYTATITIERQYFSTKTEGFTIVVNMQEIFGIPLFYFLMILGSVVAIVGSLVTYRIIQQRRIPTFVKKAKQMKKSIKGKKKISESLLYPSKEEFLVKKLGDKWTTAGLSLEELLGIKEKLKKKLPEIKKEFKGGVV